MFHHVDGDVGVWVGMIGVAWPSFEGEEGVSKSRATSGPAHRPRTASKAKGKKVLDGRGQKGARSKVLAKRGQDYLKRTAGFGY